MILKWMVESSSALTPNWEVASDSELNGSIQYKKLNSVAVVRKRTVPTERPPLVGEVSANLCGQRVLRGQRNEFPSPLISVF
jgi:hypothetical protein